MYRFAKVPINLGFAYRVTIFDILKLIIKLGDRPFETGCHLLTFQRQVLPCKYSFVNPELLGVRNMAVDLT